MNKKLKIEPELCVGCRLCLLNCSFKHENSYSEIMARLKLESDEEICFSKPVVCMHCENAPCINECPNGAISRNKYNAVVIDANDCIGCKLCMKACPNNVIKFDTKNKKAYKCDLCDGNPSCASHCPTGAIKYE